MNITNSYNLPVFKAHCPEIRLGQNACHIVNSEFPHYSMFRFGPYIKKGLSRKIISPKEYMRIMDVSPHINPNNYDNPTAYFPDLFNSINKYHCFNCHESALLSALILKLNGIKNAYTAFIRDGKARENHVLCLFNKDGSEIEIDEEGGKLIPRIINNKTIIVDPWANICDFANNALIECHNLWSNHLEPTLFKEQADGKYNLLKAKRIDIPDEFLNFLKSNYPNLILKN